MSSIGPSGDDERDAPEPADERLRPRDDKDVGREAERPPQQQPEPPAEVVSDFDWGFLAAALERDPRRGALRGEEQVMKARGRRHSWVALVLGAAVALAVLAVGCGGDDGNQSSGAEQAAAQSPVSTIETGVLTVGSDIPFPPFEFREGKEIVGFDVDLAEEMARRLGLRVKWIDTSFDTLFTQVAAGRFDMAAAATTITPERAEQVSFTDPYYSAQQALTVNAKRTPDIKSVEDLSSGDVVAVQKGTTGEEWARENVPDGVDLRSFPEAPDIYTALEAGAATAVIMDEPSAVAETAKRKALELAESIDTKERYGFAVDPRNDALLDALNRALEEIKTDGTYQRLYDRYDDLPPNGSIVAVAG